MGIFIPESQLQILDFNRAVRDLNGLNKSDFLQEVGKRFEMKSVDTSPYFPNQFHEFAMYFDGQWYSLLTKEGSYDAEDPVNYLDASILSDQLLEPILGIKRHSK